MISKEFIEKARLNSEFDMTNFSLAPGTSPMSQDEWNKAEMDLNSRIGSLKKETSAIIYNIVHDASSRLPDEEIIIPF